MTSYPNPAAFEQALKDRINRAVEGRAIPYNRFRQLLLFERFTERVYRALDDAVVTKGGLAMELRLQTARTTKDVDVHVYGDIEDRLDEVRRVAAQPGDDWFSFEVAEEGNVIEHVGEQVVYEAYRVDVRAQLGGKPFGDKFHMDVSTGDRLVAEPERKSGTDFFDFIDVDPVEHTLYPPGAHVAEKLHAWSLPRDRTNGRLKDLIDLGLLATHRQFRASELGEAIEATFEVRGTHDIPDKLPDVPDEWRPRFQGHDDYDRLPWRELAELVRTVRRFLLPVLQQQSVEVWDPQQREWSD